MIKNVYRYLRNEVRKILNGSKFSINSPLGTFVINTLYGHPLKSYVKSIKLYDRFIPYLVKHTNSGLIDIGSNIGDTLTFVKSIIDCKVICVEPDTKFLNILNENILVNNFSNVLVYPYPISSEMKKVIIEKNHYGSTGNIYESIDNLGVTTKTIKNLAAELHVDFNDYKTIKIDTDGYDWDCLESLFDYSQQNIAHFDFIYYEHQTFLNNLGPHDENCIWRENKYTDALSKLRKHGYINYYIFDNFGTFILSTNQLEILTELIKYVRRTMTQNNIQTINFCDVLICKDENIKLVTKAMRDYLNNEIRVK